MRVHKIQNKRINCKIWRKKIRLKLKRKKEKSKSCSFSHNKNKKNTKMILK